MCLVPDMIISPSTINQANLAKINFNYRSSLRNLHLVLEKNMIVLQEYIGSDSDSICKLFVLPYLLHNALFVCFHSNPIGGHLNAYYTHTSMWLQYYWPEMYTYRVRKRCQCPGCVLPNPTTKIK